MSTKRTFNFGVFTFLFAFGLYLGLSSNLALNNIVIGVLIALLTMLLLGSANVGELDVQPIPRLLWGIVRYLGFLILDVIKCGINVAKVVLDPKLPIKPGIIAVKSELSSDLGTALSAHAITITPGEMVIEIGDGGVMYTHCLDAESSGAGADAAQAHRRDLLGNILKR
jgi:multicomponent Na+:H+ antiporter subunit E